MKFQFIVLSSHRNQSALRMQQVIRRGFFPYLLQQNADHPAVALVQDPGQRGAHLFLRVGRHALQLTRQALTDQAFQAAAKEIGCSSAWGSCS